MVQLAQGSSAQLRRGKSLDAHVQCRVRNQEGSGLTIRIPRSQNERGSSSPPAVGPSISPPAIPRYAQLTTSRYAHMAPSPNGGAPVPKSKSLSTSMDKLSTTGHRGDLLVHSRGSTPSSGRSSVTKPPSRRSPAAAAAAGATTQQQQQPLQRKAKHASDGAIEKSDSPCGSEISLNSGVSSSTSVKSLPSVRSSSSASGRSSCELPRTSQPKSSNTGTSTTTAAAAGQTPTRKATVRRSSTNSSIRSSRSSTPPESKLSQQAQKVATPSTSSNGCAAAKVKSPIVATHRKNAVAGRPAAAGGGGPSSSSPSHSDTLKRRATSACSSSVSSSSTPATGTRRMLGGGLDSRGGGAGMYGGGGNTPSHTGSQDTTKKGLPIFNSYMSLFQVQEKLKKGEVIEGVLRINPKNYEDAYISAPGGGTDIYIGGVHDRNAALHGDLVAIDLLPSHHWKVLYDQLDYFLDTDETLKSLVYATHDPFAVMDEFVPPQPAAPAGQQAVDDRCQPNIKDTPNTSTPTPAVASDNVNSTADTSALTNSNKKKKNRKNRGKNKSECGDSLQSGTQGAAEVDGAAAVAAQSLKKAAIVVPPDMLSECSDVTDDESCCSDNLDLDASLEDRKFLTAQLNAAKNLGVPQDTLTFLDSSKGSSAVGSFSDVKFAELDETKGVKAGSAGAVAEERAPAAVKEEVESKGDTAAAAANSNKQNKQQQKRVSTAERLFGDKLKKNQTKNSKKKQAKLASEMENKALDELVAEIELTDKKKTKEPGKVAPAAGELPSNSAGDSSQPDGIGAPPRFMVSPYNQQVNFSASRAENNWLNHPMLNNFSNNPAPGAPAPCQPPQQQRGGGGGVSGGGGRFQRPQGQRGGGGGGYQQRQAPRQQGPGRYQQQQPAVEKRSVPSVAQVMRLSNWNRFVQKVGFVVHILEQRHTRLGAGTLKPFADMNPHFALFSPNDNRIPRMRIPMDQCPSDLFARKQHYAKLIYLAKIVAWHDSKFAQGEVIRDIGQHGDIAAETEAFLLQIGINDDEFPEPVLDELPKVPSTGWTIPPQAFEGRKDLRSSCIFSIDPASARDLDDALSCEPLPGNRFRVGVHIADVSYFVPYNNELDKFAAGRATSVYLIDKVIPMLPRVLCEQLCSLNPDEDRLAFSVIWEMDRAGHVQSTWFGRSVIRSCAKLSYDHAQMVIDNPGKVDWMDQEMPPISKGFKLSQICETITMLQSLAVNMRARRHNNGALRLDQKKLSISLDKETKKPIAVTTTESKLSNQLIEEFMLLANISVAHKIHESFPTMAVLRCHPEPQEGPLHDIVNLLRTLNIDIDITCAGSIYASLRQLAGDDRLTEARQEVIVNMLSKPMQNALYFCSGTYQEDFSHYALNVPFYTHFTSPIRRYPDVMVHRLLAAAVDPQRYPLPKMTEAEIDRRLSVSNEKKISAKRASEYSCELFLAQFVRQVREIETTGMVIGVLDHALDVLLLDFCNIKRCYLDKLPLEMLNYDNRNKNDPPAVHIVWSPDHKNQRPSVAQSFTYFTQVTVILTPFTNNQLKFNVTLVRPDS